MSFDQIAADVVTWTKNAAAALAPAAMGAFVSQAFQRGLAWGERAVQFVAGIVVSRYTTIGLTAVLDMSDGAAQAVGFVLGMIAAQATPRFIAAASDVAASLPTDLKDRLLSWLPRKKDTD